MASATPTPKQASPQQAVTFQPSSPPNKRDLKSWWKGFILPSKNQEQQETKPPGIFGIPLRQSITYANVAISLTDENDKSYIYGYVPIVVAKCGVFLKEKATGVEGIFRLSGSEKRIKELKSVFDSPDKYGKGLVWDGYTVHDAANVLRRYLNDLPEPVVPLDLYEKFRDPLRGATKQVAGDAEGPQFVPDFDEKAAISTYQQLITELPPLNRQLLLYILDLLAVFAAKSEENRMTSQNLAAIFQPGMLSHPQHAMAPEEYRLNQCVIIFLIENQDHFLIGMQGTAADETTVKEVQSGTPKGPLTPNINKNTDLNRSASNASAGAESVRRDGKLRRNRSVSSKHSKKDSPAAPTAPTAVVSSSGGLSRSNTVPSNKSPAVRGGKFSKADRDVSGSVQPLTPARLAEAPMSLGPSTPLAAPDSAPKALSGNSQDRLLENSPDAPPPIKETKERSVSNLFQRTSTEASDKRQPNKLRKKRIPGTVNLSAHSSSNSLPHSNTASPNIELPNPLDNVPLLTGAMVAQVVADNLVPTSASPAVQPVRPTISTVTNSPNETKLANLQPENAESPSSMHSSTGLSDAGHATDEHTAGLMQSPGKDRKKRWLSRSSKRDDSNGDAGSDLPPPQLNLGINQNAERSTTSFASSSKARKSFQADDSETAFAESYDSKDGENKGPIGWIKNKYREAKETAEHKRNKSPAPAGERHGIDAALGRGKSLDIKREEPAEPTKVETAPKTEEAPAAHHAAAATVIPAPMETTEPAAGTSTEQTPQAVETIKEETTEEAAVAMESVQPAEPPAQQPAPEPAPEVHAAAPAEQKATHPEVVADPKTSEAQISESKASEPVVAESVPGTASTETD